MQRSSSFPGPTGLHRIFRLCLIALCCLAIGGCSFEHDPATSVTIEITGNLDDDRREEITETLKDMTDGSSHFMTSSSSGGKTTINLSPVSDVNRFANGIVFGDVTEIDGRTVRVEVTE